MSVLVPDLKVYNYIRNGIELAAYRIVVDEHFSHSMYVHFKDKEVGKESKRLIKSWLSLNVRSYDAKYKEEYQDLYPFIRFCLVSVRPLQLLKYLKCIRYNIEVETIQKAGTPDYNKQAVTDQEMKDLRLLERWTYELTAAIIDNLPEYDQAKWSDPVEDKFEFQSLK